MLTPDTRPRLAAIVRWLPFVGGLGWLIWDGASGGMGVDLPHLLGAGGLGCAWLLGRRLWSTALLAVLLLTPLVYHFTVQLPEAARALGTQGGFVRVEGTLRGRAPATLSSRHAVRLLLGKPVLWLGSGQVKLAELEVLLPAKSVWEFPHRRRLRVGGYLATGQGGTPGDGGRLQLVLRETDYHLRAQPIRALNGEALRLALRDRAAYYLSKSALAVYLPILLGVRERTSPEAREVAGAFRRVGVAHLFAISGLHVGLLYFIFAGVQRRLSGWLQRGQGWVHGPAMGRIAVIATVWLYIALIGFPVPAVRAALMGTMLVWNELWATRSPPLYILTLAGFLLLAIDPSQLYDISFQLSFAAYFFLLCAFALRPYSGRPPTGTVVGRWRARLAEGCLLNLWVTLLISVGLWPLIASTFGSVSLLVFLGNLIMIPILSFLVLPLGLIALGISLAYLDAMPGAWPERLAFGALDALLTGWVWLVQVVERVGTALVFPVTLDWSPRTFFAYYAGVLLLIGVALWCKARWWRRERGGNPSAYPA